MRSPPSTRSSQLSLSRSASATEGRRSPADGTYVLQPVTPAAKLAEQLNAAEADVGRTTIQVGTPPAVDGFIALDWKDGRLVGLESPTRAPACTPDLLEKAEITG